MGLFDFFRFGASTAKRKSRVSPERETLAYPKLISLIGQNRAFGTPKPTPANLRYFSRTVYARRAINAIRQPIESMGWEIVSTINSAKQSATDAVKMCLSSPNSQDSFASLVGQLVEDILVTGAGVLEQAVSSNPARPLWVWPVDATTIRPVIKWDGRPNSVRFLQSEGYTGASIMSDLNARKLEAQDIVYVRMNASTETPYGYGALEIAYDTISWKLGAGRFAANLASNAQPQNLIYVGDATQDKIDIFRNFWRNEVEGQGQTPMLGGVTKPDVLKLHPGGDGALYLQWQEFLIREIATAFSISPMNLGIEHDVNRSTAEVTEDRDWDTAIIPMARMIESHINRDILHERLKMPHLQFRFVGLDREDEKSTAEIYREYYQNNLITPNEQRERLGMKPLKSEWANRTYADVQIAIAGAKNVSPPAADADLTHSEETS